MKKIPNRKQRCKSLSGVNHIVELVDFLIILKTNKSYIFYYIPKLEEVKFEKTFQYFRFAFLYFRDMIIFAKKNLFHERTNLFLYYFILLLLFWSEWRDSNPQQSAWKADTLANWVTLASQIHHLYIVSRIKCKRIF